MTAADLSGRDLDVAVARALGWEWIDVPPDCQGQNACRVLVRSERRFRDSGMDFPKVGALPEDFYVPKFSTDPATLDEKLAWLLHYGNFDIRVTPEDGVSIDFFSVFDANHDCLVQGKDVHEATARLVVAVKEAMGDGK